MQFAVIAPAPMLHRYCVTNYHMALTHLVLSDPQYAKFYLERSLRGDYVILDNSIIELGSAMSMDVILDAAARIKAHEIILPDVLRDRQGTLDLIDDVLCKYGAQLAKYKLMAVAQGQNTSEWLMCYSNLATAYPEITCIGIPKLTSSYEDLPNGRRQLCDMLTSSQVINTDKSHHLLGVWDNPIEIKYSARHKWIRGVDTILPVLCGQNGIAFDPHDGMRVPRPKITPNFKSDDDQYPHLITWNIFQMLKWGNAI